MKNFVRTTIRIRKDLLDQSRSLAFERSTTLQETINDTLASGLKRVTDLNSQKKAVQSINRLRSSLNESNFDLRELLANSKKDLR